MTKEEVILYCDAFAATQDSAQAKTAMQIAAECIRHCIDEDIDGEHLYELLKEHHYD